MWVDCYGARVRAAVIGQQQAAALRDNEPTTTDDGDGHCRRSCSSARVAGDRSSYFPYLRAGQACTRIHTYTHTVEGGKPKDTFRRPMAFRQVQDRWRTRVDDAVDGGRRGGVDDETGPPGARGACAIVVRCRFSRDEHPHIRLLRALRYVLQQP